MKPNHETFPSQATTMSGAGGYLAARHDLQVGRELPRGQRQTTSKGRTAETGGGVVPAGSAMTRGEGLTPTADGGSGRADRGMIHSQSPAVSARLVCVLILGVLVAGCGPGSGSDSTTGTGVTVGPDLTSSTTSIPNEPQTETSLGETDIYDSTGEIQPITGFGDFSGLEPNEIDDVEIMKGLVACLRDQGFPAFFDDREGMEMEGQLTVEESVRLAGVQEGCLAGLNLPAERPLDSEELRERYEFFRKAATCLEDVGWTIEEAPSLEVWIEQWPDAWQPVDSLPASVIHSGLELDGCPLRFRPGWEFDN